MLQKHIFTDVIKVKTEHIYLISEESLIHSLLCCLIAAGEEETQSADHRVLHRRGTGVFQHRQLQLPHGHHQ